LFAPVITAAPLGSSSTHDAQTVRMLTFIWLFLILYSFPFFPAGIKMVQAIDPAMIEVSKAFKSKVLFCVIDTGLDSTNFEFSGGGKLAAAAAAAATATESATSISVLSNPI
jgi:hypothetical protein